MVFAHERGKEDLVDVYPRHFVVPDSGPEWAGANTVYLLGLPAVLVVLSVLYRLGV